MSWDEKMYRKLLRLYPAEFRHAYGDLMVLHFRDMRMRKPERSGWITMLIDLIITVVREHIEVLVRRHQMERQTIYAVIGGVLLAVLVGWIDQHASEVQGTLMVLLPAGFVLGVIQPKHAWRWAVLLWLGIFAAGIIALMIGWEGPALIHSREVTGKTLEQTPISLLESAIALVPALISTYIGVGARKLVDLTIERNSGTPGAAA